MILLEVVETGTKLSRVLDSLVEQGAALGWTFIKALLVFIVGRFLISMINKLVQRVLLKRNIDPSIKTFVGSLIHIILMILLIVSVVGALGVQTASFAALLASAGVAIGMALSGNLSNFAGGLIILIFKPYKVGDFIEAQNLSGTVREIQIFHTVLTTTDNKVIYIPNGSLSSSAVINYSYQQVRRIDWTFGVEYGTDYAKVKGVLEEILAKDERILQEPAAPFIAMSQLADSSVNYVVRVWVNSPDYWNVYYDITRIVYERFNAEGIGFPFPQLTIHQAKD
ncbi:MAG: mechanosensitive ion channel [Parabacteroides sp.]|uniref:Mechanosensitive ion channel n=1 Tax=Parabacteroides faecalis TaxID=2924040 RepID=A0ABT0C622_9BACT|nr:mechanosensitive ion channel domain-containing protein [Parabacteroides faecalis]MCI7286034.1 mechanosensitive ion channel [Parabacteroides sp.]MDY6256117.1 mechanosensitive ion channel [Bacteroidales bacterium]MCJ2382390.1 mechanosensitive ion channel [Parabacteroides faecalis]MDD6950038.1 mechanosensitive ion channel [Parabacteroides sp.]MDD7561147.1 mechanosensitive ion channel [Parabacteroides sp.]